MEELLQDIFKEATGPKLASLRKSCQDALGNNVYNNTINNNYLDHNLDF